MTVTVRPAARGDAAGITDVQVASWRAGYAHIFPVDAMAAPEFDSTRREFWTAWRFGPGQSVLVATDALGDPDDTAEERVVAFGSYGPERDRGTPSRGRGELYAFYAHPDAWGTGAARELMAAVDSRLRSDGYGQAILWVLRDNPRARRFYERHGWSATGIVDQFSAYGTTAAEIEYRKEFLRVDD